MAKKSPKKGLRRRDATGHLDPRYAAELLEQSRENQTSDPPPGGFVNDEQDDLAESLGESFVQAATSAEDGDGDVGDELIRGEPIVPDGDDDDIDFEPEELSFPAPRANRRRAEPTPARRAPLRQAKVGRSKPTKRKASKSTKVASRSSTAKAKPSKAKASKAKASKTKPSKAKARKTKKTKKKS